MTLKPLFVLTMAVALRDAYTIDLSYLVALLFFPVPWRKWSDDLLMLVLVSVTVLLLIRYVEWHKWYAFAMPELMESGGEVIRFHLSQALDANTLGTHRSFMKAILLGDSSALPSGLRPLFQSLGMSHMLAVSGFHVGFWVVLFSPLDRLFKLIELKAIPFLIVSVFLLFYTVTVGSSASVIRAVWTFVLARFSSLFLQRTHSLQVPMAVAVAHFFWNPQAPTSLSFQLSYTAVFAILIALRGTNAERALLSFEFRPYKKVSRLERAALAAFVPVQISLAAWSATLPIVQYHFSGASPYFLIGNVVFVPMFTLLIWASSLQLLVGGFLPIQSATWLNSVMLNLLQGMEHVLWLLGEEPWLHV